MKNYTLNSVLGKISTAYTLKNAVPSAYIQEISSVTPYNAFISANTLNNGFTITERGFCYSTVTNPPTTGSTKWIVTGTSSTYGANITGLTSGATYYLRAYAINSDGVGYSTTSTFTTSRVTQFKVVGTRTYYLPNGCTKLEYLIIGGGGAGGMNAGGGGGAGDYRCSVAGETNGGGKALDAPLTGASLTSTFTVVVGDGGLCQVATAGYGSTNGTQSSFGSIISKGGGRGGNLDNGNLPLSGGSGGGGASNGTPATCSGATVGASAYGYRGGNGTKTTAIGTAGGGGAGGAAPDNSNDRVSDAGVGLQSSITGVAVWRGGGGSADQTTTPTNGGGGYLLVPATPNTGGGGAGSALNQLRNYLSDGASGVVIIKAFF